MIKNKKKKKKKKKKVSGCLGVKASKFTPKFSNLGAKASGYF